MWIRDKYPSGYITYIFGDFSMFRFLLFATVFFFNIEIIHLLQPVLPDAWWRPKSVFPPKNSNQQFCIFFSEFQNMLTF